MAGVLLTESAMSAEAKSSEEEEVHLELLEFYLDASIK